MIHIMLENKVTLFSELTLDEGMVVQICKTCSTHVYQLDMISS